MIIEDVFKLFCKANLAEAKNKSDYDLCIDVYAQTQLVDISAFFKDASDFIVSELIYSASEIECTATSLSVFGDLFGLEICLPFDCNFMTIFQADNPKTYVQSCYLFIREYAPMIYTGSMLFEFIDKDVLLKPIFQIFMEADSVKYNITLNGVGTNYRTEHELTLLGKHLIGWLYRSIQGVNNISVKTHDRYVVAPKHFEYYRKKSEKKTIKVQRPIYIYANKNTTPVLTKKELQGRKIERQNSWQVRGHWRRLDDPKKRGKNAQGEYIVEGFTWVKPHVCGNINMVPDKRTYIAIKE